jgi:hypothetical protein
MKLVILLTFVLASLNVNATKINGKYLKVFKEARVIKTLTIPDPISDDPVNTTIHAVYNGEELLGYIREIKTTTGCNSACLPIIYRSFHTPVGELITIQSDEGLTKKDHVQFTPADYLTLESIVAKKTTAFDKLKHPTQMTDALSGATLTTYKPLVVPLAAYTTLRVYYYNQQTKKFILSLSK